MRRHVAWSLLALVLVSCGGEPPPAAPPVPAAPTSTTPTPVAAPTMPTAATKNTRAGAVEFVKYYVEVLNYAGRTGETRALRGSFTPACDSCAAIATLIERTYSTGGRIEGNGWRFLSARSARDPSNPASVYVNTAIDVGAQTVYASGTGEPKHYPGNPKRHMLWAVERTSDAWRVSLLKVMSS